MSKNVVKHDEKKNAVTEAQFSDYSADAGQGFESQNRDDQAVPFLAIIQSNSPIIETKATARPGMLFNTVTQDVFDGKDAGVAFIPVKTEKYFVEWKPREQGGGFVKMHEVTSDLVASITSEQEFGKYKMIKGDLGSNDLVQTFYVYGILINDEGFTTPIIMAFTSTKIMAYKNWMNKANSIQMKLPDGRILNSRDFPLYAHRYRIKTISQKNAKGSFYNYTVALDGNTAAEARLPTNDALYHQAREFYKFVAGGKVKAAEHTQQQNTEAEDADIPFK